MKYLVYVSGQIGAPFADLAKAEEFANKMQAEGFSVTIALEPEDEAKPAVEPHRGGGSSPPCGPGGC